MSKNLNETLLVENLKKPINTGVSPFVNPIEDFANKKDFTADSWFFIGHCEAEGHKLNYLFHLMLLKQNEPLIINGKAVTEPVLNSVVSMVDETTGWYYGEDKMYPLSEISMTDSQDGSKTSFTINAPNGCMSGNMEKIHINAEMPHGKIDVDLVPYGSVIYNGGTGYFPFLGMKQYQYSIPNLVTNGTLTFDNKTYDIQNGKTWFDQQWQMRTANIYGHWSWMDMNLDNGDALSLWGVVDAEGKETAWATVLHPDGSQSVVTVEALSTGESEYWASKESGQVYPTHWIVRIPDLDAELEVIPAIKEQEIVSVCPMLLKYEAASSIKGTYKGKETHGYCYVELVGAWK